MLYIKIFQKKECDYMNKIYMNGEFITLENKEIEAILVEDGKITREEANHHPKKNMLLKMKKLK